MNVVAEMLLSEPAPFAIWAALMLLTLPAVLVLGSPHGVRSPHRALTDMVDFLRERGDRRREQRDQAVQAARYAEEVRSAADRAVHSAQLWQERWEQAEQTVETAWHAWLEADTRLRRGLAGAAFGTPWTPQTPSEYATRERFLHRAVFEAAARGELSPSAVADALAGRGGWDARLHPLDQELAVLRASVAHLFAAYESAVVAEKAAEHDAHLAGRTRDSLRHEATAAAVQAASLHHLLPADRMPARATARRSAVATTA
jgi:hypothetical protein